MAASPYYSALDSSPHLDDVNGDGLPDLVQVRFNAVDIWLNIDGVGWTENRHTIEGTPTVSSILNQVRLADINGSGTPDILWGDGGDYKYIDLLGGTVPGVLTHVENGLGKTTDLTYSSSTALMLAATLGPHPWVSKAPMPIHVVTRVVDRDHLGVVGRPDGSYVTEYSYRDPVYEGRQREFRGFRRAGTRKLGDANSPTTISQSTFLLGECVDEDASDGVDSCSAPERWRDNPREALKGLSVLSETLDESGTNTAAAGYTFLDATGVYSSTVHSTYRLRRIYVGLDGREVRSVFASQVDSYGYDTAAVTKSSSSATLPDVELETAPGAVSTVSQSTVTVRAAGAHTRSASVVDMFGNATDSIASGCIDGCPTVDEIITSHSEPGLPDGDLSGWLWRTKETYVVGSAHPEHRHHAIIGYDALGHVLTTSAELTGTLLLDRFHETADAGIASVPVGAATDRSLVLLSSHQTDMFGNVTKSTGAGGRCSAAQYDVPYAQFPITETIYVGSLNGAGSANPGCGTVELTTTAVYDRGLGAVTSEIDLHGEVSLVTYDGFGRLTTMTKPDPDAVGSLSRYPALTVEYFPTTDPSGQPFSAVHVQTQDGADPKVSSYHNTWSYVDGLGRTIAGADEADTTAGDDAPWVVSGRVDYDGKGAAERAYLPWFTNFSPDPHKLPALASTAYKRIRYDAFGRTVQSFNIDGTIAAQIVYHALSTDAYDAADLAPGPHQGTPTTQRKDGHGRAVSSIERIHVAGQVEQRETKTAYLPTGEVTSVTRARVGSTDSVVRWMQYDSLGRRVLNVDPNTTSGTMPAEGTNSSQFHAWRYAYNDAGDLVGTSDARGCGVNFFYDSGGRILGEDFSPCLATHAAYSAPNLATGSGLEAAYLYDVADPDSTNVPGFTVDASLLKGRPVSTTDRGAKVLFQYDGRGRGTGVAKRVARPGTPSPEPSLRFAPRWYVSRAEFDAADRPVITSTGARAPELLGANQASTVTTDYSKRGAVRQVDSSYGVLVAGVTREADGLVREVTYGDLAQTKTHSTFDARRRLASVQTYRSGHWSPPPAGYTPVPPSVPDTLQLLLEDTDFTYDAVDNPTQIRDWRVPDEWPAGAKPVSRTMQYDDLYRLTRVDSQYAGGDDWVSPFAAENGGAEDTKHAAPSPHVSFDRRIQYQTFDYDWLGNTKTTSDDAQGFYDRSLGTITNGTAGNGPYQLKAAANAPASARSGALTTAYDPSGNLVALAMERKGPCLPAGAKCSQRYAYDWDEVGRLVRARRWDLASIIPAGAPPPAGAPDADLRYAYDSGNVRVLKTAEDAQANQRHTVFALGSLELRRAAWLEDTTNPANSDYVDSAETEVPYLFAHGVRLARVAYDKTAPAIGTVASHVFLEIPDHLGSTGIVIDKATGELVERTTFEAYGGTESDYRPDRWSAFREDYKFTGKEEDSEVGLTYFGARFLSPMLGRWMSADPLAVHGLGADLNLYAYVHGQVFKATDPLGLDSNGAEGNSAGTNGGAAGDAAAPAGPPPAAGPPSVPSPPPVAAPTGSGEVTLPTVHIEGKVPGISPQSAAERNVTRFGELGSAIDSWVKGDTGWKAERWQQSYNGANPDSPAAHRANADRAVLEGGIAVATLGA